MDDYISRQAVIEAFENADKDVMANYGEYYGCEWGFSSGTVNQTINNITSADVRLVVRGRWIRLSRGDMCDQCGYRTGKYEEGRNFCPICGADMRGE